MLPERLEAEAEFMSELREQGLTGDELREEAMGTRAEYEEILAEQHEKASERFAELHEDVQSTGYSLLDLEGLIKRNPSNPAGADAAGADAAGAGSASAAAPAAPATSAELEADAEHKTAFESAWNDCVRSFRNRARARLVSAVLQTHPPSARQTEPHPMPQQQNHLQHQRLRLPRQRRPRCRWQRLLHPSATEWEDKQRRRKPLSKA